MMVLVSKYNTENVQTKLCCKEKKRSNWLSNVLKVAFQIKFANSNLQKFALSESDPAIPTQFG